MTLKLLKFAYFIKKKNYIYPKRDRQSISKALSVILKLGLQIILNKGHGRKNKSTSSMILLFSTGNKVNGTSENVSQIKVPIILYLKIL